MQRGIQNMKTHDSEYIEANITVIGIIVDGIVLIISRVQEQHEGESGQPWRDVDPTDRGRCWSVPLTGTYSEYIETHFIPNYRQIASIHDRLNALDEARTYPLAGKTEQCQGSSDIWLLVRGVRCKI